MLFLGLSPLGPVVTGAECSCVSITSSCALGPPLRRLLVYIGYWPSENAAVVAYEGTDPTELYVHPFDYNSATLRIAVQIVHVDRYQGREKTS